MVGAGADLGADLMTGVMVGGGAVGCGQSEGGSVCMVGESCLGSVVGEGRQVLMVPILDSGMLEGEVVTPEEGVRGGRRSS
jgi:hypothetical protein